MKDLATENSPPSEPSDAAQSSMKDRLIRQSKNSFTPLHCNEPNCLLGFRSDAKAIELYDAATLWVIAKTCPSTCIRPDQSLALDLTGMLAENSHWCRSRQATTGQMRPLTSGSFRPKWSTKPSLGKVQASEMGLSLERHVADGDFFPNLRTFVRADSFEWARIKRSSVASIEWDIVQNSQPESIVRVNAPTAISW